MKFANGERLLPCPSLVHVSLLCLCLSHCLSLARALALCVCVSASLLIEPRCPCTLTGSSQLSPSACAPSVCLHSMCMVAPRPEKTLLFARGVGRARVAGREKARVCGPCILVQGLGLSQTWQGVSEPRKQIFQMSSLLSCWQWASHK